MKSTVTEGEQPSTTTTATTRLESDGDQQQQQQQQSPSPLPSSDNEAAPVIIVEKLDEDEQDEEVEPSATTGNHTLSAGKAQVLALTSSSSSQLQPTTTTSSSRQETSSSTTSTASQQQPSHQSSSMESEKMRILDLQEQQSHYHNEDKALPVTTEKEEEDVVVPQHRSTTTSNQGISSTSSSTPGTSPTTITTPTAGRPPSTTTTTRRMTTEAGAVAVDSLRRLRQTNVEDDDDNDTNTDSNNTHQTENNIGGADDEDESMMMVPVIQARLVEEDTAAIMAMRRAVAVAAANQEEEMKRMRYQVAEETRISILNNAVVGEAVKEQNHGGGANDDGAASSWKTGTGFMFLFGLVIVVSVLAGVLVGGNSNRGGDGGILQSNGATTPDNDRCDQAQSLSLETSSPVPINTTTIGATITSDQQNVPACGDVAADDDAGVWYNVVGNGLPLSISTCPTNVNPSTRTVTISIFVVDVGDDGDTNSNGCNAPNDDGDVTCGSLVCIKSEIQECGNVISWISQPDSIYRILATTSPIPSDFVLYLTDGTYNDICESAEFVQILPARDISSTNDTALIRSLANATVFPNIPNCYGESDYNGNNQGPGIWFTVVGTGDLFKASTCGPINAADSNSTNITFAASSSVDFVTNSTVSVYSGSCDTLTCVDSVETYCDGSNEVSWVTQPSGLYYTLVRGPEDYATESSTTDFMLHVTKSEPNDICEGATYINDRIGVDGKAIISGSTLEATVDMDYDACGDATNVTTPGVWYR